MASVVKLTDLSRDQVAKIIRELTIQPINPGEEEQKKWGRKKKFVPLKPPVMMYQMTEDAKAVRLPYRYACTILNKMANQDKPHLQVVWGPGERLECKSGTVEVKEWTPKFQGELRDYQIGPAQEAYTQLFTYGTTTLGLPPGFGKTIVGVWLWYLTKYAGIVFVHRDTIARQWIKSFTKCVPELEGKIWFVGETSLTPGTIPPVTICLDGRIDQVPEYVRKAIGTAIFDEFHLLCTPDRAPRGAMNGNPARIGCLLALEPRYVIAETATLERDDGMHAMAHCIVGTHGVFRVSTQPYAVLSIETGIFVEEKKTSWGTSFDGICKGLSASQERNLMIVDIILSNPHRKTIILTRLAPHVELLQQYLTHYGVKCATLYRSKSTYSDSPVLIGTVPKVGTGFDEENACEDFQGHKADVLILAHSVKKWQLFEQLRGRVMRSDAPIVIWFNDKNQMIRRHLRGLEGWIANTNGTLETRVYQQGTIRLPAVPIKVAPTAGGTSVPASRLDIRTANPKEPDPRVEAQQDAQALVSAFTVNKLEDIPVLPGA